MSILNKTKFGSLFLFLFTSILLIHDPFNCILHSQAFLLQLFGVKLGAPQSRLPHSNLTQTNTQRRSFLTPQDTPFITQSNDKFNTTTTTTHQSLTTDPQTSSKPPPAQPIFRIAFFTFSTSEFYTSASLAGEMALRGHNVTLCVDSSRAQDMPKGVSHYSFGKGDEWPEAFRSASYHLQTLPIHSSVDFFHLIEDVAISMEQLLNQQMKKYFEKMVEQDTLPDACVFTWLFEGFWHYCTSRNIPVIEQVPSVLTAPFFLNQPSRPVEDVFMLDYPTRKPTTIRNRSLLNRVKGLATWFFIKAILPVVPIRRYKNLKPREFSLRLVHSAPGFDFPSEHSQLVHYTGPIHPESIFNARNIPSDVLDFLIESQSLNLPVVYVSFGTLVRLTKDKFHNIYNGLDAHAGDKWRVLWSLDKLPKDFSLDSKHIKIVKWTSGPAVIAHNAVKLTIQHCGSNGAHESLYQRKPMIGIPFFGDQTAICDRLVAGGAGLSLCHYSASSSAVRDSVIKILENYKEYATSAFHLSLAMKAMGGLKKAADLVEVASILGHDKIIDLWKPPSEVNGIFTTYFLDIALLAFLLPFLTIICFPMRIVKKGFKTVWHLPNRSKKRV